MSRITPLVAVGLLGLQVFIVTTAGAKQPAKTKRSLSAEPRKVHLANARSRQQLLITAQDGRGYQLDVTANASFKSSDPNVASVSKRGIIRPKNQGKAIISATFGKRTASVRVTVGNLRRSKPVSFNNEVMAVLGKAGCNGGQCHGHNSGKGGFKLSLRGYHPMKDHAALTEKDSGRVDVKAPDDSLILRMPTSATDHGGGTRFAVGSDFHAILRRWIASGAKVDSKRVASIKRLQLLPEKRLFSRRQLTQQLVVLAHYDDGTVRDVTHLSSFELSKEGPVEVTPSGVVTAKRVGEAAVFVRFLGKMGLSYMTVIEHRDRFSWSSPQATNFIDQHIHAKLKSIQVLPSKTSSDAEFLRRVYLDTVAHPPSAKEVRDFLQDKRAGKRARKIDELLKQGEFGDQWAAYWLELSGTTESGDSARFKGAWTLSLWLRNAINRNLAYDRFVRHLVASKGSSIERPAMTFTTNQLARNEVFTQLFLGIRLQCAKCHDHPFDVWTQADYKSLARVFSGLGYKEGPLGSYGREIRRFVKPEHFLPWKKNESVVLRMLDGSTVKVAGTRDRREALVDWTFAAGKRQAAKALVNRVWGRLFGRGIVEPVDDMRLSNPAVNQPLLDALADHFIEHRYDFKDLVRTILNSQTYQRSSRTNSTNQQDETNFSHSRLRRLPAEHLLDSITQVTGVDQKFRIGPPGIRAVNLPFINIQSRFLEIFGRPNDRLSPCVCARTSDPTLPQILHLLNGSTVSQRLRSKDGTLQKLLQSCLDNSQLIDEIYVHVLSRFPTKRDKQIAARYLRRSKDRQQAAADLMWSLITSQEFLFNH